MNQYLKEFSHSSKIDNLSTSKRHITPHTWAFAVGTMVAVGPPQNLEYFMKSNL